jgi:hypothetical protein
MYDVSTENTLFVSKSGNDSTAQRGLSNKPFLTITAARDAAQEGDLIVVYPGTYNDSNLIRNNLTYFCYEGVTLTGSTPLRCSIPQPFNFAFTGYADIVTSGSCLLIQGIEYNGSNIFIQANKLECTSFGDAVRLRAEVTGRIEIRDEIIGGTLGLDFRLEAINVIVKAKNVRIINSYNSNCYTVSAVSLPVNAYVDITLDTLSELQGVNTNSPTMAISGSVGKMKINIRNPIIVNRLEGSMFHIDRADVDLTADIITSNIPIITTSHWSGGFNDITLNGKFITNGSNAIDLANRNGKLTINGYIKSSNYGIVNRATQANSNIILENAIIESEAESIFSTQVINVKVVKEFNYKTPPNSNVTLVKTFNTFPSLTSYEQHINNEDIHISTFKTINHYNIIGSGNIDLKYNDLSEKPIRAFNLEMGVSSYTEVITMGAKGRKTISFDGVIVGWRLVSDVITYTRIDLWKANNQIPTKLNTITGSAKPILNNTEFATSNDLSNWITTVNKNDVIVLEVEANNNAKYIHLELEIIKL